MTEALFLNPVFQDRIWGGTKLHDYFGYDIPSNTTGKTGRFPLIRMVLP